MDDQVEGHDASLRLPFFCHDSLCTIFVDTEGLILILEAAYEPFPVAIPTGQQPREKSCRSAEYIITPSALTRFEDQEAICIDDRPTSRNSRYSSESDSSTRKHRTPSSPLSQSPSGTSTQGTSPPMSSQSGEVELAEAESEADHLVQHTGLSTATSSDIRRKLRLMLRQSQIGYGTDVISSIHPGHLPVEMSSLFNRLLQRLVIGKCSTNLTLEVFDFMMTHDRYELLDYLLTHESLRCDVKAALLRPFEVRNQKLRDGTLFKMPEALSNSLGTKPRPRSKKRKRDTP